VTVVARSRTGSWVAGQRDHESICAAHAGVPTIAAREKKDKWGLVIQHSDQGKSMTFKSAASQNGQRTAVAVLALSGIARCPLYKPVVRSKADVTRLRDVSDVLDNLSVL
jgi:hypothetical protein